MKRLIRPIAGRLQWLKSAKFKWQSAERTDIVIFDVTNIDYLKPLCGNSKIAELAIPEQEVALSIGVICKMAALLSRGAGLQTAYYAARIFAMRPAIVITFIDNSDLFYRVAKACHPAIRFLAIQNAARYDILELAPRVARRIFLPEFACFGDFEREIYSRVGAKVGRFYPIGSLREAYYRRFRTTANGPDATAGFDYDLCVIAEASPGWDRLYPGFEDAIGRIAQYALRLARERGLKLVIAGKRDIDPNEQRAAFHSRDAECLWYEKYIGGEIAVTPRVRDKFTTYELVSKSRLSLAMVSTALREGMSRGCRTLFCNFSGNPLWDFSIDGIWRLTEDSYEAFRDRVTTILAFSDEEYSGLSKEMARHVINNDPENPTDEYLQNLISDAVSGVHEATL